MKYGFGPNQILSCSDAVAKAVEKSLNTPIEINVIKQEEISVENFIKEAEQKEVVNSVKNGACPECGGPIQYVEGCDVCYSCGYSHCS